MAINLFKTRHVVGVLWRGHITIRFYPKLLSC